ncbi:MAG: ISAca5, transposase [Edaphobacter sp.]|nr:ISAca5, transposase [Edaphobacter sp.]
MTIGIDLGDVWSHYCTLNQDGEVVDRGHFRTTPKAIEKWFTDVPPTRVAMEAGTHSIWISEQLQEPATRNNISERNSCDILKISQFARSAQSRSLRARRWSTSCFAMQPADCIA